MENPGTIWSKAVELMKDELSKMSFDSWIKPIEPLSIDGGEIMLKVPTPDFRNMVTQRYGEIVISALKTTVDEYGDGEELVPVYVTEDELPSETEEVIPINPRLNPLYTFSTFVVGPSNQLAHAAAVGVANAPGKTRNNPLFIYSSTGLGKTHLMHAIGNYILSNDPSSNVMYVSSERFTNDLIFSMQTGKNSEFREKYRNVDVLLLDDVQFIGDKPRTQEEFFHTFNDLYDEKKQIVMTSDRPPREIRELTERLVSRFESGLIVDIGIPDYETRIAILMRKSKQERFDIPDPTVFDYIAKSDIRNIRELEGSLTRVMTYSALLGKPLTSELVEEALKTFLHSKKKVLTPEAIQRAVCSYYGLTMAELTSKRKSKDLVVPRQIAMYIICSKTEVPLVKIGQLFGRDHTTVMHARDKITNDIRTDSSLKESVDDIIKRLTE